MSHDHSRRYDADRKKSTVSFLSVLANSRIYFPHETPGSSARFRPERELQGSGPMILVSGASDGQGAEDEAFSHQVSL
jgi:hypothetical protein